MAVHKIDLIIKEYEKGIQRFFPSLKVGGSFKVYSGDEPSGAKYRLRTDENELTTTDHFVDEKNLELIHFTGLQAGLSIIENEELWMSQVDRCNDSKELVFAHVNNLENIQEIKKRCFITSFSNYKTLKEEEIFSMWRHYGNNGNGLALVFEIEEPKDVARRFLLGELIYGVDSKAYKNFNDLMKFDSDFREKHPGVIKNEYFIEFLMISLLLKTTIWQTEKEIRLIAYHNYDKSTLESNDDEYKNAALLEIYHTIGNDAMHRAFLKLPIAGSIKYRDLEEQILSLPGSYEIDYFIPKLKLKEVKLGYQHKIDSRMDLLKFIYKNLKKYDNNPIFSPSGFEKYF